MRDKIQRHFQEDNRLHNILNLESTLEKHSENNGDDFLFDHDGLG